MNAAQLNRSVRYQRDMVNKWNAEHPVGMSVSVLLDSGDTKQTKTRSEAWLMGEHSAMVMLEGISGGYSLERVTAL